MYRARTPSECRNARGFTIIELLIVVAIIGILSVIMIPRLFNAAEKAKQKRSMADLRIIAGAVEYYAVDFGIYPVIGETIAESLSPHLCPEIITIIPAKDGWNHAMRYSGTTGETYTLLSFGNNLAPDLPYIVGPTTRFRDDIVLTNGRFLQWPEGTQSNK